MEALDFLFRIGVLLAVYNFLWWLIMLIFNLLRGGSEKHLFEIYLIKFVRYAFLSDVIYLFIVHHSEGNLTFNSFLLSGLILLIYLVGRAQSKQRKQSRFIIRGNVNIPGVDRMLKQVRPSFDVRFEISVIVITMLLFIGFYSFPYFANNNVSIWFLDTIKGLIAAPIFGFIFKVIGFFFMVSVIFKVVNGFLSILTPHRDDRQEEDNDHFDDYTDIND